MRRSQSIHVVGVWMKITNPQRIAARRRKLGYTQADLANLVGCTQQYISLMENGQDTDCSERIALKICKRLDLDMEVAFEEREVFGVSPKTSSKRGIKDRAA